jgi:hypothetical protein
MGTRIVLCALLAAVAWGQQERKLTPREMFYSAPPTAPGAESKVPEHKPKAKPRVDKPGTPAPESIAKDRVTPPPDVKTVPAREEVKFVNAAYHTPLGLRYSILKRGSEGEQEVDADTVFHAGDRIRLSVEVNDAGYLYIVNRGSSGTWKVLFPSPEIAGGDNRVERGKRYLIPSGYTFTFDEQPGVEKLFLIVSRQPESDLDSLVYSLGHTAKPAEENKPAPKVLLAQNLTLDDSLIGRLRNTYARDLLIEKVGEKASAASTEKAVYTVNPSGAADARVVADVVLRHD